MHLLACVLDMQPCQAVVVLLLPAEAGPKGPWAGGAALLPPAAPFHRSADAAMSSGVGALVEEE